MHEIDEKVPKLHWQRMVEPKLGAQRCDGLTGRGRAQHEHGWVAGIDLMRKKLTRRMPKSCGRMKSTRWPRNGSKPLMPRTLSPTCGQVAR